MNQTTSAATNTRDLLRIAQNAQDVLVKADTMFPFTLFPDTVIIDRVKLSVKRRYFFDFANKITSIQIEDIMNVQAQTGPLFGTLKVWTRVYAEDPALVVTHLPNKGALALKRVLQGFIIAHQKNVDCSNIDRDSLVNLLHKLGKEATV